jgi:hypothetical protein
MYSREAVTGFSSSLTLMKFASKDQRITLPSKSYDQSLRIETSFGGEFIPTSPLPPTAFNTITNTEDPEEAY